MRLHASLFLVALQTTTALAPLARRALCEAAAAATAAAALPAHAEKPFNPLNLKGQFWETGNMVYVKPTRDPDALPGDVAAARSAVAEAVDALRDARRAAERGDASDAVFSRLRETVTERTLRVSGAVLVDTAPDAFVAQEALSRASRAFARAQTAADRPSELSTAAVGALTATGLIFVVPGGPSMANNAAERRQTSADPGLDVVVALSDCIDALGALLAAAAAPPR